MASLVIVADDLTGAADTAGGFALAGLVTLLVLGDGPFPDADVLAVSTDSRHLDPERAAERTRATLATVQSSIDELRGTWIYKKIDSTLRGNPGVELEVLMDALGLERALVAPAFPDQGRATIAGRQLVDGVPLAETAFGREADSSEVAAAFKFDWAGSPPLVPLDVVRQGVDAVRAAFDAATSGLIIADAATAADLETLALAARASDIRILCGSAGLARALPAALGLMPAAPRPPITPRPHGPILVVAASRHARTAGQIDHCLAAGFPVVVPEAAVLAGQDSRLDPLVDALCSHLSEGKHAILTTHGLERLPVEPRLVASRLAEVARLALARVAAGGLVLTGGDVASAVCDCLNARALWLRDEIEPGIPSGVLLGGAQSGLRVVTKAGGFGGSDALLRAVERLYCQPGDREAPPAPGGPAG